MRWGFGGIGMGWWKWDPTKFWLFVGDFKVVCRSKIPEHVLGYQSSHVFDVLYMHCCENIKLIYLYNTGFTRPPKKCQ